MIGAVALPGVSLPQVARFLPRKGRGRPCPQRSLVIVQCSQVEPYTGKKRNAIRKNTVFIRRSPSLWNYFPLKQSSLRCARTACRQSNTLFAWQQWARTSCRGAKAEASPWAFNAATHRMIRGDSFVIPTALWRFTGIRTRLVLQRLEASCPRDVTGRCQNEEPGMKGSGKPPALRAGSLGGAGLPQKPEVASHLGGW